MCPSPSCVSALLRPLLLQQSPLKWWPFSSHIPGATEPEGWWISSMPLIVASGLLLFSPPKLPSRRMPSHCAPQYPPQGRRGHLARHICWFTGCFHAWLTAFVFISPRHYSWWHRYPPEQPIWHAWPLGCSALSLLTRFALPHCVITLVVIPEALSLPATSSPIKFCLEQPIPFTVHLPASL